jgi:hypothetical protein
MDTTPEGMMLLRGVDLGRRKGERKALGPATAGGDGDGPREAGRFRRILGAVTEPHAVRRLLAALGLAAEPPPAPVLPAA